MENANELVKKGWVITNSGKGYTTLEKPKKVKWAWLIVLGLVIPLWGAIIYLIIHAVKSSKKLTLPSRD